MNATLEQRVIASFFGAFDARPTLLVQAPGRVNLIGEHTDYNEGFVLPCAIDVHTQIAASLRQDASVRVVASDYGHAVDEFRIDAPIPTKAKPAWANYVRGIWAMMAARGLPLRGMNLAIAGDVPRGAGLSSSASLEVAVARTVQALCGLDTLSLSDLALLAQQAENEFVGCQCGIMDQLVCAKGLQGHALLIDCQDLSTRSVAIPAQTALLIVHSHVRRGLVDSEYNLRRAQCQAAAAHLGVSSLRQAQLEELIANRATMDPVAWKRAHHVITENRRTLQAAAALAQADLVALGQLMAESHASMRDDFEITVPAIDRLVDILQPIAGPNGGARMTGGGFGGCVVAVLPESQLAQAVQAVEQQYRSPEGQPAGIHICRAEHGVQLRQLTA